MLALLSDVFDILYTQRLFLSLGLVYIVLERIFPLEPAQRFNREGFGQDWIWYSITDILLPRFIALIRALIFFNLFRVAVPQWKGFDLGSAALTIVVVFFLRDFLSYGLHYCMHRFPPLWRMHTLHHSNRQLDWLAGFRGYWVENLLSDVMLTIPLLIFAVGMNEVFILSIIEMNVVIFVHANIRQPRGSWESWVNSPRAHRWHHDVLLHKRYGQNFGVYTLIWDQLFGTFYMKDGVPKQLGVAESLRYPDGFFARFFYPFYSRSGEFFLRFSYGALWMLEQVSPFEKLRAFLSTKRGHVYRELLAVAPAPAERTHTVLEASTREPICVETLSRLDLTQPAVFRKLGADTECVKKWDFEYLGKKHSGMNQPFFSSDDVEKSIRVLEISETLQKIQNQNERLSIIFGDLLHRSPDTLKELQLNTWVDPEILGKLNQSYQLFVSPKGSFTNLHAEICSTFTLQITGKKRWIMFKPEDSFFLEPKVTHMMYLLSSKKYQNLTLESLPPGITPWVIDLEPGDVLYTPPFVWHFVTNLEPSISVGVKGSHWRTLWDHPLLSFFILTSRNPSILSRMGRSKGDFAPAGLELT
ncbi:sterol desaturase family protein [bacterium]|nr:sterol desaturase family protein [bacterium]